MTSHVCLSILCRVGPSHPQVCTKAGIIFSGPEGWYQYTTTGTTDLFLTCIFTKEATYGSELQENKIISCLIGILCILAGRERRREHAVCPGLSFHTETNTQAVYTGPGH